MANSLPTPQALVVTRSPIVNKDGTATWEFLKILQDWSLRITNSLDILGQFIGELNQDTQISGRGGTIGTALQNVTPGGVVQPAGITPASPVAQGGVILPNGAATNALGSAALAETSQFDMAGSAAQAQANAEAFAGNAANLSSGTLSPDRLPAPTTNSLGGVLALVETPSQWVNAISVTGRPQTSQPGFADLTGAATAAQLPDLSALNGQITAAQLPANSPVVSFGAGAPSAASTEGYLYFDTTATPYVGYVYHSGAWAQF